MKTLFVAVRAVLYAAGFLLLRAWLAETVRGCDARLGAGLPAWVAPVVAHLFAVLVEEPGLAERFGASYRDYCAVTRRWIPRLPRQAS